MAKLAKFFPGENFHVYRNSFSMLHIACVNSWECLGTKLFSAYCLFLNLGYAFIVHSGYDSYAWLPITPRACARGKVIGSVAVVMDTKIAKSQKISVGQSALCH